MEIIELNNKNIIYLENFLKNNIPDTFRYFSKRNIDVIDNHLLTIVLLKDDESVGYAHIDFDDNKYWFGICIIPEYQGKGYGKLMMEYLFNNKKLENINEIYLTVDKININAIGLYKKFNFNILSEKETYYLMKK
jgi:ribosomal-protein-alanine N-acetyltransferase